MQRQKKKNKKKHHDLQNTTQKCNDNAHETAQNSGDQNQIKCLRPLKSHFCQVWLQMY